MKRSLFLLLLVVVLTIACSKAYTRRFVLLDKEQSNDLGGWHFEFNIFAFEDVVGDYTELGERIDYFQIWVYAMYFKKNNISPFTDIQIDTLYITKRPDNIKQTWLLYIENEY